MSFSQKRPSGHPFRPRPQRRGARPCTRNARAEHGKRQAVAGAAAEAMQAQAGTAMTCARSWAAVAAGNPGATKTPAGRRALGILRPSAGGDAAGDPGGGDGDHRVALRGMGRELRRARQEA